MSTTTQLIEPAPFPLPSAARAVRGPLVVAGVGSIGRRHLANLRRLGVDDVILYRTGHGGREAYLPDAVIETDLDAALSYRPAAVLVCNPTAVHVPVALEAARAGCALFMEKPISHSLDGLTELAGEIERRRLTVLLGFQFRFHPTLRRIREWIALGEIGDVVSVRAHWGEYLPDWHPYEDYRASYSARRDLGGGVVLTLSHPFDYLRWLIGEVVEVSAFTGRRSGLGLEVEDLAQVCLRFSNGALGTVSLDYAERPPSHELHIIGRRGSIRWNDADGIAWLQTDETSRRIAARPPHGFDRNAMFLDEMRHFLACLAGDAAPACRFEDGVAALRIALAAKQSAARGRSVDV